MNKYTFVWNIKNQNTKNDFNNNPLAKINNSSYHQAYKELNYDVGGNNYIPDGCSLDLIKSVIKILREQLLCLKCNVGRGVELHYYTLCNNRGVEDMYHYMSIKKHGRQ